MNFSETVFVYPATAGGNAKIRIFTPFNELPFAGHPVLGSAFVLAGPMQLPTIVLETASSWCRVVLQREGAKIIFGWIDAAVADGDGRARRDRDRRRTRRREARAAR